MDTALVIAGLLALVLLAIQTAWYCHEVRRFRIAEAQIIRNIAELNSQINQLKAEREQLLNDRSEDWTR